MSNKQIGYWYVAGQFGLLLAILSLPPATGWSDSTPLGYLANGAFAVGWVVLLLSSFRLGRSLTANPVPLERASLKTTGLYAVVRHPIYLGIILIGGGLAIKTENLLGFLELAALIVLLNFKARFEEKMLRVKFPEYSSYASRVGRLLPWLGRDKTTSTGGGK